METTENSPKIFAMFQCQIPRQIERKLFTLSTVFWRAGDVNFSYLAGAEMIALLSKYDGTQNDYTHTHTFYYLGIHFPITQDICYTWLSGRNSFAYFGHL